MAGQLWWYAVPYRPDAQAALDALRDREFRAGRYFPAIESPSFPVTPSSPAPGAQHSSIDEAIAAAEETGTRSILDFEEIATADDDWGIRAFSADRLLQLFGTAQPTLAQVEGHQALTEWIGRGEGYVITTYHAGQPDSLYFVGSSFD
ncbi:hypothetical protein ACINK0_00505 [Deinococcus sp. VB343]|uniref:Uncharacterized protein n=1 Tax=Deinococcus sp. VB142 TaxID=3112952 RepID=A0AAU6Q1V1_9DEIO